MKRLIVFIATGLCVVRFHAGAQVIEVGNDYIHGFEIALNEYRAAHSLTPLNRDSKVERPANHHAEYLAALHQEAIDLVATHDEYKHVQGVIALGSMQRRYTFYGFKNYGECVAVFDEEGLIEPIELLAEWINSEPHRKVLVGGFNSCGLAVNYFERDGHAVTCAVLALTNR